MKVLTNTSSGIANKNSDKHLVISGMFWNAAQIAINQGFTFFIRLLLAKLLAPQQFGVVGMAAIFTGFIQVLNDLGIGAALVQKKEQDLTEEHFHTAFWTGVIWSVIIFLIISFMVAPLAAVFYDEPILRSIIPVMSIGILSSPVNIVHKAQLTKQMDFKKTAFITNSSTIFSGIVAIVLALLGAGIWSLVFNSVASFIVAMPMYFKATGWKPKFIWGKQAFKDVFGFGMFTTGSNVFNYLFNNIDYLLIGKLLNASALGAYTLAFVLTDTFRSRLMSVVNNVMYPLYGKKQDNPDTLKKYYLKVVQYNSLIIFPVMVFFVAYGHPFISNFFGKKWTETILPLQILAVSVMFHMMVNSNAALIRGLGRPGLDMKLQFFKAAIFVPSLSIGIYYYGIVGAAWAVLINKIIAVIIAQYTFRYLINIKISTKDFLNGIKIPALASVVAFVCVQGFNFITRNYIIGGIFLLLCYVTVVWLVMGKELKQQIADFKKNKKKK